ncbi:MAG: S24 family peptidase, partial [Bacteroidota bacterium]
IMIDQAIDLINHYELNANYLFGHSEAMFHRDLEEIPNAAGSSISFSGRNNITLVPDRAMAGYAIGKDKFEYLDNLQKFSIPGMDGTLIGFEISGDSMMPTITNGDTVICEKLEPGDPIRDNHVYVIVTDVVVAKRVQQIKTGNSLTELRLISDNPTYQPYVIGVEEIRQILKVKRRITNYSFN